MVRTLRLKNVGIKPIACYGAEELLHHLLEKELIYQVASSGSCVTKEGKDVTVLVSRDIINNKDWTCISFLDQKRRSVSFSMKCL
jgi:hypothetical protein